MYLVEDSEELGLLKRVSSYVDRNLLNGIYLS